MPSFPGLFLCRRRYHNRGECSTRSFCGYADNWPLDKPAVNAAILPFMNDEFIADLARRLRKLVPPPVQGAAKDLERNFRALLQSALGRIEYVTLEEFEVQKHVLERTRRKVEALEQTLAEIESKDA